MLALSPGDINFVVNAEPHSQAEEFARAHGPSVCGMAFRVSDAGRAQQYAIGQGPKPFVGKIGPMELNIPAIYGIGESTLSFVDRYGERGSIYDVDFIFYPDWQARMAEVDAGLYEIDHLTHNVHRGNMNLWSNFYERIGNFREIRYFDIEGKLTGLHSRAMTAPCGKIRIPINESADDKSQIEEYLRQYKGRGSSTSRSPLPTSITPSARSEGGEPASCRRRTPTTRRWTAGSQVIRRIWPR